MLINFDIIKRIGLVAVLIGCLTLIMPFVSFSSNYSNTIGGETFIVSFSGKEYVLDYYGSMENISGMEPIPKNIMGKFGDWCFSEVLSGSMSPIIGFKLLARLSTIDDKYEWGFSTSPDNFGFWKIYNWAGHANNALAVMRGPGIVNNDGKISSVFGDDLVVAGLAKSDKGLLYRFAEDKNLSVGNKKDLVRICRKAEYTMGIDNSFVYKMKPDGVQRKKNVLFGIRLLNK